MVKKKKKMVGEKKEIKREKKNSVLHSALQAGKREGIELLMPFLQKRSKAHYFYTF